MKRSLLSGLLFLGAVPSVTSAASISTSDAVDEVAGMTDPIELWHVVTAEAALVLVVGFAVIALSDGWGGQVLRYARSGLLISLFVGLPAVLGMIGLVFAGAVLMATVFGSVLGIPILVVVGTLLLLWHAVGFVGVGTWMSAKIGAGGGVGVIIGAALGGTLVGAATIAPYAAGLPLIVVSALGVGASARVSYGRLIVGTTERKVPPKQQHIKQ